jgi:hypothetical protein
MHSCATCNWYKYIWGCFIWNQTWVETYGTRFPWFFYCCLTIKLWKTLTFLFGSIFCYYFNKQFKPSSLKIDSILREFDDQMSKLEKSCDLKSRINFGSKQPKFFQSLEIFSSIYQVVIFGSGDDCIAIEIYYRSIEIIGFSNRN